ncbi:hypothetical protein [Actinomadura sp. NPDC048394]|uniref:hypothetical protein n=1 Tax=Actinomadura sp. NPDC048394 TaxID=3158223 RepID=UPI0033EBD5F7
MSTLEDRYRRLLACYPAAHREAHGEEMLDVLLSAASPGQTRPSLADAADLLLGAARIRLRRAASGTGASPWADALAVTGFLATLLFVGGALRLAANTPYALTIAAEPDTSMKVYGLLYFFGTAPYWLAWTVIAVLAWRGMRRPAAVGACAVTTVQIAFALYGTVLQDHAYAYLGRDFAGASLPLALLTTASIVASPGPRHGARLLGRRRVAGAAVLVAAFVALHSHPLFSLVVGEPPHHPSDQVMNRWVENIETWSELKLAGMLAAAVLTIAALASTRAHRRACALLAVVAAPVVIGASDLVFPGTEPGELVLLPRLLAFGTVGFALAMLSVHLVEAPLRMRARRKGQSLA